MGNVRKNDSFYTRLFPTQGKRDEINENYPVQATFYSIAWEERTGEKIEQIVILTTTETGELDVYIDDPSKHVKRLEEMIDEYKSGI